MKGWNSHNLPRTPKRKPHSGAGKAQGRPTTGSLTDAIIHLLALHGWKAFRVNSVGIWDAAKGIYRKNPKQLKGISDVLCFHRKTGHIGAVEVKVGRDKLSPYQEQFLSEVRASGGFACEGRSVEQVERELKEYMETVILTIKRKAA